MGLSRAITDRIFGFDVFISYSRTDGVAYAHKLEEDLRRAGFRCFLDSKEMPPGETLQGSLRSALKRSSSLVLVASRGAVQHSRYMPQEFDYYTSARKRQKIVPISIGHVLDDAPAELPLCQRIRGRADVIWISEESVRLVEGPSAETLKSLVDSFRFTRRNTIRNRVVSAVSLVLAVLLVLAIWMGVRAERQRRIAVTERNRAQRTLSEADYQQAAQASKNDRNEEALAFLARAIESDSTNEMAISRLLSLLLYRNWPAEQFGLEHGEPLAAVGFSADGRLIFTAGKDGSAKIWNAGDGELLHTFAHGAPILKAAFSPTGSQIVTADAKSVRVWDSRSGKQLGPDLLHDYPVTDFVFDPAGKLLATACAGPTPAPSEDEPSPAPGYTQLWDLATSKASGPRLRDGQGATHLAWHPKERWLALGIDGSVQLWDARANKPRFDIWKIMGLFSAELSALAFNNTGKRLIAASASYADGIVSESGVDAVGGVRMWDTESGKSLFPVENVDTHAMEPYHESWVRDAAIVGDEEAWEGISILTASDAGEAASWWKVSEEGERLRFETRRDQTALHEMSVERLILHGSESMITIANNRATGFGYARRWRTPRFRMVASSERMEHTGLVTGAAWSPDGGRVVTIGDDGFARVWWTGPTEAVEEGISLVKAQDVASRPDTNLALDPAPREITLAPGLSLDGPQLPQPLAHELSEPRAALDVNRIRFVVLVGSESYFAFRSPDGHWLMTTKQLDERSPAEATLWDLTTSRRGGRLSMPLPVLDVAFAHGLARFAVASGSNMGGSVRVFAMPDAQPLTPAFVFGGTGKPLQLSFGPRANRLAIGFASDPMNNDSEVGVFDAASGLPLIETRFPVRVDDVIRFLPDGQRLAVGPASESRFCDVPTSASPVPNWLPELARVMARRELNNANTVQRIRVVTSRLEALMAKVRASPDSPAKTVALMVLAKPGERRFSPFARQTRRERLEEEMGDWKQRADKAMRGPEEDLESAIPPLLDEGRGLSDRTFGDTTFLALIASQKATLQERLAKANQKSNETRPQ